jgi:AcrR family transcriptional regulator
MPHELHGAMLSPMAANDLDVRRPRNGIQERKREAVRAHLAEVALELLADRDFDSVTVDEISVAAGVSRRTFFRYFASKEDVILGFLDQLGDRLCERIVSMPPEVPPLAAVHSALLPHVLAYAADTSRTMRLVRQLQQSPSLRARELESRHRLKEKVSEAIGRRLALDDRADLTPRLLAGVAMVPFDVAIARWLEGRAGGDLGVILEQAISSLNRQLPELRPA